MRLTVNISIVYRLMPPNVQLPVERGDNSVHILYKILRYYRKFLKNLTLYLVQYCSNLVRIVQY